MNDDWSRLGPLPRIKPPEVTAVEGFDDTVRPSARLLVSNRTRRRSAAAGVSRSGGGVAGGSLNSLAELLAAYGSIISSIVAPGSSMMSALFRWERRYKQTDQRPAGG
jgi:hypothetical protein